MKILDANFLIDYLAGIEVTKEFYETNGGGSERWVMPVPAYAEALVGELMRESSRSAFESWSVNATIMSTSLSLVVPP